MKEKIDEQNKYISSTSLLHLVTLINSDIIHNYLDLSAQKCFSLNKPSALALKKYLNLQQTIYVNKNEKNNKSYTYYLNQIITSICEKYKILKPNVTIKTIVAVKIPFFI